MHIRIDESQLRLLYSRRRTFLDEIISGNHFFINTINLTSICEARSDDAFSFNRVKYMSFNNDITEEIFLDDLEARLVKAITKHKKKRTLKDAADDDSFDDVILSVLDQVKMVMGINVLALPSHCHIIYASMANSILTRLRKELLTSDDDLSIIIWRVVRTNDNIYSRVIASYYLHMAS